MGLCISKPSSSSYREKSVELSVCKAGGSQTEYTRITLTDVLVASVRYTGARGEDTLGVACYCQRPRHTPLGDEQAPQVRLLHTPGHFQPCGSEPDALILPHTQVTQLKDDAYAER
jgi:hypothetical protein